MKDSFNKKTLYKIAAILIPMAVLLLVFTLGKSGASPVSYSDPENWAFYEEGTGEADVFFICPTVDLGTEGNTNMSLSDEAVKESFVGASRMELGIYDANAVVYAPFYRQITLEAYSLPEEELTPCLQLAYSDVNNAFSYYLKHSDSTRPLILAGFSQGAEMVVELLKEHGNEAMIQSRLVAAYAIGWRLSEKETGEYPWLVPASGESDTGCIVLFNSEAEGVTDSLMVPADTWTYSINPLNWKTDSTPAEATENRGACFTDYSGEILTEIPALTGAYIDSTRGTLICPDVNPLDYPGVLFPDGIYHLYDYQFFYRNLQENVAIRLAAWKQAR